MYRPLPRFRLAPCVCARCSSDLDDSVRGRDDSLLAHVLQLRLRLLRLRLPQLLLLLLPVRLRQLALLARLLVRDSLRVGRLHLRLLHLRLLRLRLGHFLLQQLLLGGGGDGLAALRLRLLRLGRLLASRLLLDLRLASGRGLLLLLLLQFRLLLLDGHLELRRLRRRLDALLELLALASIHAKSKNSPPLMINRTSQGSED